MTTPKVRSYWLTLNDDGRPTHICLFEREEGRLQLELVDKSDYDSLATQVKEKDAEITRLRSAIENATNAWCIKPECKCFLCEALAKGDANGSLP